MILGIDPGTTHSAFVIYDESKKKLAGKGHVKNQLLLGRIEDLADDGKTAEWRLAIEMVSSYGMPVGESTFETVLWIGRFIQAWSCDGACTKVYRKRRGAVESVAMHLCKSNRAKDGNIRQALIDKFPSTGGGAKPVIGTKGQPGPLYGVSKHIWSALAVAVTYAECSECSECSE